MSSDNDPEAPKSKRLSPEELAGEIARRLRSTRSERGGHRRRPRFDIVTASRIGMVIGGVLVAVGVVLAVGWVARLAGFETTATVVAETPVFGCPGEQPLGVVFSGETVELVGRTEDDLWLAIRDERGPGNVVYAASLQIDPDEDPDQLSVRSCEPRDDAEVAGAVITATTGAISTSSTASTTVNSTVPGSTTTTLAGAGSGARPPRRPSPGPGGTSTTTTTTPGTTSSSTSTSTPGSSSTSTSTPGTSTTSTSTTTSSTTTTTTTTSSTTSTTLATTTTTTPTTTTTTVDTSTTTTEAATTTTTTTTAP